MQQAKNKPNRQVWRIAKEKRGVFSGHFIVAGSNQSDGSFNGVSFGRSGLTSLIDVAGSSDWPLIVVSSVVFHENRVERTVFHHFPQSCLDPLCKGFV